MSEFEVELKNINKSFGDFKASRDINFGIKKGRLVGLLGPSGSGKTTILRMIAGLENPDSGDIFIGGERVNDVVAGKRGIGFVFQSYALFRHMTVFDNVAFGLTLLNKDKEFINKKVNELLELVGLAKFSHRYPAELSGGQRQRVAFARALAPEPKLLLLDEPFAAIDAKVRKELRQWLKTTINELGITSIFVTHDQDEAIEVADDIIITNKGRIEQVGTPADIYREPNTSFVAEFIGDSIRLDDISKFKGFDINEDNTSTEGIGGIIRPEFLEIAADESEASMPLGSEEGKVIATYFRGNNIQVDLEVKGEILHGWRSIEKKPLKRGDKALVFIHRIYSFKNNHTTILENRGKLKDSVII